MKIYDGRQLPAMMTVAETAALLGVSAPQVRKMCRAGTLPACKIGPKLWRIDKAALLAQMKGETA